MLPAVANWSLRSLIGSANASLIERSGLINEAKPSIISYRREPISEPKSNHLATEGSLLVSEANLLAERSEA
jgi:hypothetical protein